MSHEVTHLVAATEAIAGQLESFLEGQFDPLEPYIGPNGELWEPLGSAAGGATGIPLHESSAPYVDDPGLTQVRRVCRHFAKENPFAINGYENRISYIVGTGHTYTVVDREKDSSSEQQRRKVQAVIDRWVDVSGWRWRQPENVLRQDRDGEVFLRFFESSDGYLRVRYVEPVAVKTPDRFLNTDSHHLSFGIETEPHDHETVLNYFVNGETVPADEIQHRRRGSSDNKRGVPIFWAVRHNLIRAMKILRNGSTVTEIQTAIGMVRKFLKASGATVQAWQAKQSQDATNQPEEGEAKPLYQKFEPGAILNSSGNIEYEFPGMAIDPSRYVTSLQAELRAIAARLVMTEAMFSAKTDDTSRAAAEVSEGPVRRNFERLQAEEIAADREVLRKVLQHARDHGLLTDDDIEATDIDVQGPTLNVRDPKSESERHAIDIASGKLSIQTACGESGYDYEREQTNIEAHEDRTGAVSGGLPVDFLADNTDDEEGPDDDTP